MGKTWALAVSCFACCCNPRARGTGDCDNPREPCGSDRLPVCSLQTHKTNGSSESGRQQRNATSLPGVSSKWQKKCCPEKKENVRQGGGVGGDTRSNFSPVFFCEAVISHSAGLRRGGYGALQQARRCGVVFVQKKKKENAVIKMWKAAGKCMRVHLSSQGGVRYEGTWAELLASLVRCVQVPASLWQNKHMAPVTH